MTRRLAFAAALLVFVLVTAGCSEQSSLSIDNQTAEAAVVRVYFNDFDESFGFDVPAGLRAWAWAPLEGRVAGPIAVYDTGCRLLWSQTIPAGGGSLVLAADGAVTLVGTDAAAPPTQATSLAYTEACATAGNPRRLPASPAP